MKVKHKNFTAELMELFPEKVIFKNPEIMKDGKVSRIWTTLYDKKQADFWANWKNWEDDLIQDYFLYCKINWHLMADLVNY